MKKLAVIGPGLLGGSIALAAKDLPGWSVAAWARREEAVKELAESGTVALASTNLEEIATDADLLVLCTPIGVMPEIGRQLAAIIPGHAIVTDVGSVKAPVVEQLSPLFEKRGTFIGSHPMAGSEQTGFQSARADLFRDSVCIVTPGAQAHPLAVEALSRFWDALGCRVRLLDPVEHDEVVALVSHLPHFLAAVLVQTVSRENPAAFDFAGPGFRDTTRVASGPPGMWTEILRSNRAAVKKSAEAMIEMLQETLKLLDSPSSGGDLHMNEFLAHAKTERDRLRRTS